MTALVTSPYAIKRQPSVTETFKVKLLVATKATKGGSYCCTLNKTHDTCVWNSYKYDSFKHSIAVSHGENILESHLQNIKQGTGGSRAGLVTPVNDNCAGKKGHKAKNPWRASRSCQTSSSTSDQNTTQSVPEGFTPAVHHNDKPFVVTFIDDAPKAQECRTCKTGFIRRTKIIPFDIVLGHEKWMCPDQRDKPKWVPSATTNTKYYSIMQRFPYFNVFFLEVPSTTKENLQISHFKILELGYKQ